jgi:AbrB family looped-hinge helix DNA binding protein
MNTAIISSKGQVTLPKSVRQALNVKPGQRVLFVVEDKTVFLQAIGQANAKSLAGSLAKYAAFRPSGRSRSEVKKEVARAAAKEG